MPSSTAPISCSRETCFSALSWRRAPTKSRLTIASSSAHGCQITAGPKKRRGGHPRHGAAVQLRRVYTRTRGRLKREPLGARSADRGDRCGVLAGLRWLRDDARPWIPRCNVVLEDVNELGDQAVAAQRPVELAVDEHGSDGLFERAGQADP